MTAARDYNEAQRFLDATHHTVLWFWKRLQANELDMTPPYQRNPVWQDAQKAYLIDTILRGYPAPEIYLQTVVSGLGEEKHIVVDGQQRIRACLEYIEDVFPLGEHSDGLSGTYFSGLTEETRRKFFEYKFVIRNLPSLPEAEIREIFGRLNRNNVALNRQELRHSTYWGEFISTMHRLSDAEFWSRSGLFTANDFRRMLDVEYISQLAVLQLFGPQNKATRLDYYYANFESEFPDKERLESEFNLIVTELQSLLPWPNRYRWSRKVDFYTLFGVMGRRVSEFPLDRQARDAFSSKMIEFSDEVTRLLRLDEEDQLDATRFRSAFAYARGVRNSSDVGSRRLRAAALNAYLDDKELPSVADSSEAESALGDLPALEVLMEAPEEEASSEDG